MAVSGAGVSEVVRILVAFAPVIAFAIIYVLDFYSLKREGVCGKLAGFPSTEVALIIFLAILGVPFVLIRRRRAVKDYLARGNKPLSGTHRCFNVAYGIIIGFMSIWFVCWFYNVVYELAWRFL